MDRLKLVRGLLVVIAVLAAVMMAAPYQSMAMEDKLVIVTSYT